MSWTTLNIRPRQSRSGRTHSEASYSIHGTNAGSEAEVIDFALNKSQFHYVAGKKVYEINVAVASALAEKDFEIVYEFDSESNPKI
jgi:hypothetical protein